jgi:hypothetical protein
MKDRIQIDGVWYVRELEPEPETEFLDVQIHTSISVHYENDDYSWEAISLIKDDGSQYDGFDIKFTNKNIKPWKDDYWDNMKWIKGVYENNPDSIKEALEEMNENGIKHFRSFLNELNKIGWF